MLYRVLKDLLMKESVVSAGEFVLGDSLTQDQITRLSAVGAISQLHAPPLEVIPEFAVHATILSGIGIVDAEQLLEADIEETSRKLDIGVTELRSWRAFVSNWLIVPDSRPHG